ncbi:MFS transporter, partial [Thermodesulfobacteriota bacterium]
LLDRLGSRKILFTGVFFIGLGLILLSRLSSLIMFFGIFMLLSAGMSTCHAVVPMAVVGNWFRRKVSLATGIVVSGPAFGALLVPVLTLVMDRFGWRIAMIAFGLGVWVIILPLTLFIRHKPEPYGLFPDGEPVDYISINGKSYPEQIVERDFGIKETLRSRFFWHISIGMMCHAMAIAAVLTHVMPYLSSLGISRSTSSLAACVLPLSSILGRLSAGWFGDYYNKKLVTAVCFILTCISMLLFGYLTTSGRWLLFPFLLFLGIGYGGPIPMNSAMLREYFGRAHLGAVLGACQGVLFIGVVFGPLLAGWAFDYYGNYFTAWFAMAGILIIGLLVIVTAPPYDIALKKQASPE